MRKSGLTLIVALVILVVVAWVVNLGQMASDTVEYNAQLKQAERYSEESLFQKAIACYDNALAQKDSKKVRDLWLEAYKNAFEDQAIALDDYTGALEQVCTLFPEESRYWETLIATYMENNDINNAYKSYIKCQKAEAISDTVAGYANSILYTFSVKGRSFPEYIQSAEGYYTVFDGEEWGVLDPVGNTVFDSIYEYIGPFNSSYQALYVSGNGQRLMSSKMVVEAKLDIAFTKVGAYVNGLLPVCGENGIWQYLDCKTNSYLTGNYEQASNFANGVAAVCKDGKWMLINTVGEQVCKMVFSDVKLHSNGDYLYDGIMIAAVNGEYGFYDAEGATLSDFKAKDMDIYLGGYVAFADAAGKWGYVAKNGKVILEAQFAKAKSFANNLAAVSNGQQWGFVNARGEKVIAEQFMDAGYFTSQGTCMVSVQEGYYNLLKLKFAVQ